jgi:hypothetical protein
MGNPTVIPLWFGGVTGISNVVDLTAVKFVVGLIMPAAWTPAVLTIEGSADGANFYVMYDGQRPTRLTISVAPGTMVPVNPDRMRCCKAVRLISGDRNTLIPQDEPREFGLIVET